MLLPIFALMRSKPATFLLFHPINSKILRDLFPPHSENAGERLATVKKSRTMRYLRFRKNVQKRPLAIGTPHVQQTCHFLMSTDEFRRFKLFHKFSNITAECSTVSYLTENVTKTSWHRIHSFNTNHETLYRSSGGVVKHFPRDAARNDHRIFSLSPPRPGLTPRSCPRR